MAFYTLKLWNDKGFTWIYDNSIHDNIYTVRCVYHLFNIQSLIDKECGSKKGKL